MLVVIPQNPEVWKGYFQHLKVTKEAAVAYGNSVFVLEPFPCPAVDEFRKYYLHNSPNPVWFERWCFEQWIYLAEWMELANQKVVFKIDSDTLIFTDLGKIWKDCGCPTITTWVPDMFITANMAMQVSNYIIETFREGLEIERQLPANHASDQSVIGSFVKGRSSDPLWLNNSETMLCDSLFSTHEGPTYEDHKDVWFVQGQPCWVRPNCYTKLLTLHCWGAAKTKMDVIWNQSRSSIGVNPVRLAIGQCHA